MIYKQKYIERERNNIWVENLLNIQTSLELKSYEIYDISGKLMDMRNFSSNQIDIQSLQGGAYFVVINTTNNIRKTLKFIKK
jgi:hypothetical protein